MDNQKIIDTKPLEFFLNNIIPPHQLVELIDDLVYDYILMYFKLENMQENVIEGEADSYLYFLKSLRDVLKECSNNKKAR